VAGAASGGDRPGGRSRPPLSHRRPLAPARRLNPLQPRHRGRAETDRVLDAVGDEDFGAVRRLRAQPSPTPPQYRPGCSTPTACANTPMPHDDANTSPLTRPTPTQRAPTRQSRRSAYAPTSPSPATRSAGCAPTTTNSATGYACNSVLRSTGAARESLRRVIKDHNRPQP